MVTNQAPITPDLDALRRLSEALTAMTAPWAGVRDGFLAEIAGDGGNRTAFSGSAPPLTAEIAGALLRARGVLADPTLLRPAPDGGGSGTEPLWCCHVRGPDDVYAAPDYVTALRWSDVMNGVAASVAHRADNPIVRAVPAPWPWGATAHAAALPDAIAQFKTPDGREVEPRLWAPRNPPPIPSPTVSTTDGDGAAHPHPEPSR